jgi:hypothetical protein
VEAMRWRCGFCIVCVCVVVVCRMEQNLVILSTNGVLGQKGKGKGERMSPAVPFSCVWKIASPFLDSGLCPLILLLMCEEEVRRGEFDRKEFVRDLRQKRYYARSLRYSCALLRS